MMWPSEPLRRVAPPRASPRRFDNSEEVWHLTLDQIESHTGRIIGRKLAPAGAAGTSTFVFDEGNVLYSKLRPYLNKVVRPAEAGIATSELVPLRPTPGLLDPSFLTYFLRSADFVAFASTCVAGVKMPRVIMDKLWEHPVPLPLPSEQRRIVELLDQAEALRRQRAEADAKADRVIPALFLRMFGEPTTNRRHLPVVPLGRLIAEGPQNGLYRPVSAYGRGTRILRIDGFYSGRVTDLADLKRLEATAAEVEKYGLRELDIVINRVNSEEYLGKSAIIPPLDEPVLFESNMMRFSVDSKEVLPLFVIAHLQTPFTRREILRKAKRAINQASINQQDVAGLSFLKPPRHEQERFASMVLRAQAAAMERRAVSAKLETTIQVMLRSAFSGELTASWREAHSKDLLRERDAQRHHLAALQVSEASV